MGGSTNDGWLEDYTSVNKKSTYIEKNRLCWQTKGGVGKKRAALADKWQHCQKNGWVGGKKGWGGKTGG